MMTASRGRSRARSGARSRTAPCAAPRRFAHTHGEPGDGAVDDLGFDDVVTELRGLGQRSADGRVVEVVPVPDVFEER